MANYQALLDSAGPVAIVIRETLRPVGGHGSVIFPPTYAPDKEIGAKKSGYNIDEFKDGNRCVIDSVQAQANAIEPVFLREPYKELAPQVSVKAGAKIVNLLEASHRLADAAARYSELSDEVDNAFGAYLARGDASKIAKLSPMSILFGAWDSRGTQAKLPRILGSTIYAENVRLLTRSSQFNPSFTVDDISDKGEEDLSDTEQKKWSEAGLAHAPGKALGGVLVGGKIIREAIVNLIALRKLKADGDEPTQLLREYILGLTLVCATLPQDYDLRSGCQLVRDGKNGLSAKLVNRDGEETPFPLVHDEAMKFAKHAASEFGVLPPREVNFEKMKAVAYLEGRASKKSAKSKAKKGA